MSVAISGPPAAIRGSKVDVEILRACAERVLKALGLRESELSIALVDDSEIAGLNAQWREQARPTDVLSFSLLEGDHADHRAGMLGDVVISVETASRQAADRHRSLDDIVTRLMIHGVLHLIGHDHEDDTEARAMSAEERRLWKAVRS
jgi:probable rRNA maturation factor